MTSALSELISSTRDDKKSTTDFDSDGDLLFVTDFVIVLRMLIISVLKTTTTKDCVDLIGFDLSLTAVLIIIFLIGTIKGFFRSIVRSFFR